MTLCLKRSPHAFRGSLQGGLMKLSKHPGICSFPVRRQKKLTVLFASLILVLSSSAGWAIDDAAMVALFGNSTPSETLHGELCKRAYSPKERSEMAHWALESMKAQRDGILQ